MKRRLVLSLTMALVVSLSSWAVAGKTPAGQSSPKKSVTGTIEKLNAKAETVTVKLTSIGQQIQTQSAPTQKEGKKEGSMTFQVTESTEIVAKAAAQETTRFGLLKVGQMVRVVYTEAAAPASEPASDDKPAQGQMPEKKKKKKPQPTQQTVPSEQKEKGKDKPKPPQVDQKDRPPAPAAPQEATTQKDKPQPPQVGQQDKPEQEIVKKKKKKKDKPQPIQQQAGQQDSGKKGKKGLVAIRIEILTQPSGQQASSDK